MNRSFKEKIVHLKEVDSTNAYAEGLLKMEEKPVDGCIIYTERQTKGRGLDQNKWETADNKNLILSYIVYPNFMHIADQFMITVMTSLAISDLIRKYAPHPEEVKIKWPNDIYVGKGKIAGVLIQNALLGTQISHSIIGIGTNINQDTFTSDAPNPISLKQLSGIDYHLDDLLHELAAYLDKRYQQLHDTDQWNEMYHTYISRFFRYQEEAMYEVDGKRIKGTIQGVDEFGRLILSIEDETRIFDLKEVKFIL